MWKLFFKPDLHVVQQEEQKRQVEKSKNVIWGLRNHPKLDLTIIFQNEYVRCMHHMYELWKMIVKFNLGWWKNVYGCP